MSSSSTRATADTGASVHIHAGHPLPLGTTETRTVTQFFLTKETTLDEAMVPIGWDVPGKRVRLLDEEGAEVAPGEIGEIAVFSRYLSPGYWGNAEATRDADGRAYQWATEVLFEVRKQRSEAKQPLKIPITKVIVTAEADAIALMPIVGADLKAALRVQAFETAIGEPREIVVQGYEAAPQV